PPPCPAPGRDRSDWCGGIRPPPGDSAPGARRGRPRPGRAALSAPEAPADARPDPAGPADTRAWSRCRDRRDICARRRAAAAREWRRRASARSPLLRRDWLAPERSAGRGRRAWHGTRRADPEAAYAATSRRPAWRRTAG